jgi:hypothetical protein
MPTLVRISSARVLGERRVEITLTNGQVREVDLAPLLDGPVFEAIRADDELFAQVQVDTEFGTLVWPSGADLCPDVVIHDRPPA